MQPLCVRRFGLWLNEKAFEMTPALKAMVEAMVAEVTRQVYTDYTTEDSSPAPFVNDLVVDGHLDLEKVARAGLAAIDQPPLDHPVWSSHDPAAPDAFHQYICAVLGEPMRVEVRGDQWMPADRIPKDQP